ncbi:hypothetical protein KCP71_10930 [Salmonella enterica subsp. enterica]|nr:hypothetical protein KCP71_10930 [Salmonella enterica subsp. enterica]
MVTGPTLCPADPSKEKSYSRYLSAFPLYAIPSRRWRKRSYCRDNFFDMLKDDANPYTTSDGKSTGSWGNGKGIAGKHKIKFLLAEAHALKASARRLHQH